MLVYRPVFLLITKWIVIMMMVMMMLGYVPGNLDRNRLLFYNVNIVGFLPLISNSTDNDDYYYYY